MQHGATSRLDTVRSDHTGALRKPEWLRDLPG